MFPIHSQTFDDLVETIFNIITIKILIFFSITYYSNVSFYYIVDKITIYLMNAFTEFHRYSQLFYQRYNKKIRSNEMIKKSFPTRCKKINSKNLSIKHSIYKSCSLEIYAADM